MIDPLSVRPGSGILRHVAIAFLLAVALYLASYYGLEHLRTRKGGWQFTFQTDAAGAPLLLVSQPRLSVSNVAMIFPKERIAQTNQIVPVIFDRPITNVPFGRVVYFDTTFLPGSVVLD